MPKELRRKMKIVVTFVWLLAGFATASEAYRILCLFPFNGKSHHYMFDSLCKGLAEKGHQIDMISHFPTKSPPPNFRDIMDLNGTLMTVVNSFSVDFARSIDNGLTYSLATQFGSKVCDLMGTEQMQKFIKNPPKGQYDLIITEYFGSPCYLAFGPFLNATTIIMVSSAEYPIVNDFMGNPYSSAFYPGVLIDYAVLSNFWERLVNAWTNLVIPGLFAYYTTTQTDIARKYLGEDIPDIRELERRVPLALVNAHYTYQGVRPLTPAMKHVGGLHVKDTSEMPQDLKNWMDSAKAGVVYFTLGSLINIETLPEATIRDLYTSFAKLAPIKVLMKSADKTKLPPGMPSNMHVRSWMPQVPILKHNNTKAFITHGGLMGSMEAVHYGLPVIVMPVFADQLRNARIFVHKRIGVMVHIDNINQASMDAALDAVLNDPQYRENAKRQSALFRDRPMSPLDTAIFWVEYIIRNRPETLRSPAVDMPWWQLYLIDIYAFLIICFAVLLYVSFFCLSILYKWICGSVSNPDSVKKKVN